MRDIPTNRETGHTASSRYYKLLKDRRTYVLRRDSEFHHSYVISKVYLLCAGNAAGRSDFMTAPTYVRAIDVFRTMLGDYSAMMPEDNIFVAPEFYIRIDKLPPRPAQERQIGGVN